MSGGWGPPPSFMSRIAASNPYCSSAVAVVKAVGVLGGCMLQGQARVSRTCILQSQDVLSPRRRPTTSTGPRKSATIVRTMHDTEYFDEISAYMEQAAGYAQCQDECDEHVACKLEAG